VLDGLQIFGRVPAAAAILNDLEAELLALYNRAHSGVFNGRDMDENIRPAIVGRNKTKALVRIEKLHDASVHDDFLS
jgi:hypothetical protein